MSQIKFCFKTLWKEDADFPCSDAWENMLDYLDKKENWDSDNEISVSALRRELNKMGGRYLEKSESLIFPNEKSYMLWMLKWS